MPCLENSLSEGLEKLFLGKGGEILSRLKEKEEEVKVLRLTEMSRTSG